MGAKVLCMSAVHETKLERISCENARNHETMCYETSTLVAHLLYICSD